MDVKSMSTEALQAILREDAQKLDQEPDMAFLSPIVEELTRRRKILYPNSKTTEEAHQEFLEHYMAKGNR